MSDTLILFQVPGISKESVGTPIYELEPRQEAEAQAQSQEATHLEVAFVSYGSELKISSFISLPEI